MGCTSCGQTNYSPFNPYPKPNPCSPCNKGYDNCDDAVQIAYVPGTACTIGITYHCMTSTLSLKEGIQNCETDTRFVWNSDTGCIDYHSERYVNQMEGSYIQSVCASQIASAINLCELNDVADTACDPENCALLVYTKNTDCGENCKGVNDMWAPWTVKANLADYLTYVMGFNEEGCPVALDKPDTESEYWWAMWRGDNKFGYTQPTEADSLPTDENGDPLVISQNPDGSPIIAPLKTNTDDIVYHTIARTSLVVEQGYYGQTDFEIRIDSTEGNDGTTEAPDDMIAFVNFCADYTGTTAVLRTITVTVGENTDNFDEDYIRDRGRHFQQSTSDWAVPGSIAVVVHKGNHLKFHASGVADDDDLPHFRMHQIDVVWMTLHQYREYRK